MGWGLIKAKPLPRSWLVHTITYYQKQTGRDEWGNPKHDAEINIKNVRYDENSTFTRSVGEDNLSINGVIFVDAKHSTPTTSFVENSKVTFQGKDMVIHKVVTCYHPESDSVHHWELEVV